MKIYIDSEFKCHITDDGTMMAVETDFFDGKCDTYIEGYRFIPEGKTWISEDGEAFSGEMVAPWEDYTDLVNAQQNYDADQLANYESALAEIEKALGV